MIEIGLFELGLLLWVAFIIGKWYNNWYTRNNMKELLDDLGVPYDEQLSLQEKSRQMIAGPKTIILTKMNDIFYAHDENEKFLGQDRNREELFKYIAKTCGEGQYKVVDNTGN